MAPGRLAGVRAACVAAGVDSPLEQPVGPTAADAAAAVAAWRAAGVTAVCAYNDDVALAVLAGMRRHNLTAPADLALIGTDDIPAAQLTDPPLTTIRFDLTDAGRRLAEAVAERLAGRTPPTATPTGDPRLIEREST
jgi:DNA-binding LacI/PurR family transcriptional regulator